jgi:hypothetical protein
LSDLSSRVESAREVGVAFDTKFRREMARVKAGVEAVDEMKKSKIM